MTKLIKRIFLGAVIVVLGGAVIFSAVQSSSNSNKSSSPKGLAVSETGDEGVWQYNRMIKIDNTADSALTDHQVKIELNSANFDFGKANSNGDDIRFTEENKKTEIPNYWIESWDKEGEVAIVWVKVPYVPASSTKKIYIHYGNSSAVSISNGNSTFEFFDDFEDGDLDGWEVPYPDLPVISDKWSSGGGKYSVRISNSSNIKKEFTLPNVRVLADVNITYVKRIELYMEPTHQMISQPVGETYNWESNTITSSSYNLIFRNEETGPDARIAGYIDRIRIRKYISPEPSVTVGKERTVQSGSY